MHSIEIEWDEYSIEHIWSHFVQPEDVEAVLRGRHLFQKGRQQTYYALGQSQDGRYLFVVLRRKASGRYRVVTACEMSESERKQFRKKVR